MKVLITGGYGFIGRNLWKYFKKIPKWSVYRFKGDITRPSEVNKEFNDFNPDVVIHCAAIVSSVKCELAGAYSFSVNVLGTYNVAKITKELGAKLIYVGTTASYKPQPYDITENTPTEPKTLYGFTKLLGEEVSKWVDENCLILRLCYVYGPFDGHSGIWTVIHQTFKNEPAILLMSPDSLKDYLYIDDVCDAFKLAIQKDLKGIYNVSRYRPRKLKDVMEIVKEKLVEFEIKHEPKIVYVSEADYLGDHVVRNHKFCSHTGWSPKIELEEGIAKCIQALLEKQLEN